MTFPQAIAGLATLALVTGCLGTLRAWIRFGVISERRTRGWEDRLGQPHREEVEAGWKVRLPRVLEEFYRSSGLVECFEFYLSPPGADHPVGISNIVETRQRDRATVGTALRVDELERLALGRRTVQQRRAPLQPDATERAPRPGHSLARASGWCGEDA